MSAEFKCLAIETATQNCSVAVCRGTRVSLRETANSGAQSRGLFGLIAAVLEEGALSLADLDCIGLGVGPGGFTGLRVGAAAAQALAFGAGLPVCRVSTLATLALGTARASGAGLVAACLDARIGEAYIGRYRIDAAGSVEADVADRLIDPQLFNFAGHAEFFAAGPGWKAFPQLADRHAALLIGSDYLRLPSAVDMLSLAEQILRAGQAVAPNEALPNYVRNAVTS